MKILMLVGRYPPLCGGYELACHNMAEALGKVGHRITVLTSTLCKTPEKSLNVRVVPELKIQSARPVAVRLTGWVFREIHNRRVVAGLLREDKYDAIVVWKPWPVTQRILFWMQESECPIVYYLHDSWMIPSRLGHWQEFWQRRPERADLRITKAILIKIGAKRAIELLLAPWFQGRVAVPTADNSIYVSRSCREEYALAGFPVNNSPIVYNGIDMERFNSGERSFKSRQKRILFLGRVEKLKGVHILLEAFAKLVTKSGYDYYLDIVGPIELISYQEVLQSIIESAGISDRVAFHDALPFNKIPECYRNHDVLVFPSTGTERFPLAIIEAMASGLPVVTTLTGGHREFLEDGINCLVCRTGDVQHLSEQLGALLTNPDLMARISLKGKKLILKQFSIEKSYQQFESFLLQQISSESRVNIKRHDH